jgi:hypothetical protein
MRSSELLEGVVTHLRSALPAEWAGFHAQRRAHLLKLWYVEPRLHYEVWPVSGRDLIEVGLHFEADTAVNQRLVAWFDPHLIRLKAALDGAVELEQWTASWGHLFHVFRAPVLDATVQAAVNQWMTRLIPLTEPLLQAALAEIGPLTATSVQPRDWAAWRKRRAERARQRGATARG